ncbi:2-isopropylmalate synthase [Acinetobacter sp. HY1485]|uniref:2-isopropylmalate synthase n=1 Tax=Acinetobacter sp. HY1485 TaxID=2970918 RepID=UPI0022B95354|nr:2-isopropylmalate synthase [Acinetobacter sp. HY1485]
MLSNPETKYRPQPHVTLTHRTWVNNKTTHAPRWCSTDLRDGNQALANPMTLEQKLKFFQMLVACGFKEIEVAFPSASDTEFRFVRHLIEQSLIPDDMTIQVMTQARPELISRTFEAVKGAKNVIIHVYNATAESFRRIVFKKTKAEVISLATQATQQIVQQCLNAPETNWTYQYSPETFCFTEEDFALEICEAVAKIWQPSTQRPFILNLPTTVEVHTPNIFADQIESFCQKYSQCKNTCISIHPHNDRGTGVATAELALLAGAQRIEGCLFGNGERSGNVDLVNIALNLYTQGISPQLDFSHIQDVAKVVKECNQLPIHPRHPYVGELIFTAFSGSHQDAIKKGFAVQQANTLWEVPYLPIDPADLGCSYEAIIRLNSQSGKSATAWILQQNYGITLPPQLQQHFNAYIQQKTDALKRELTHQDVWEAFQALYQQPNTVLEHYHMQNHHIQFKVKTAQDTLDYQGTGAGLVSAVANALNVDVIDYSQHSLGNHTDSLSISYVQLGNQQWGVAIHEDVSHSAIQAILNAQ